MPRIWMFIAAVLEAAAVVAGAASAHQQGQSSALAANLHLYETAQRYHALFALALFVVGAILWLAEERLPCCSRRLMNIAASLLTVGIVCFSGGLYAKIAFELSNMPLIPVGGTCLIVSWIMLAVSILLLKRPTPQG